MHSIQTNLVSYFLLIIHSCHIGKSNNNIDGNVGEESNDHKTKIIINKRKLSSFTINESLNNLRQDDPKLIKIIREKYLIRPSDLQYNFSSFNINISGEFGQAAYVEDTFFRVR